LTLHDIQRLFEQHGREQYTGEPVTHREHALQSATLGKRGGASEALITAAMLHDLGHLLHDISGTLSAEGAVRLRLWDHQAKQPGMVTPPLAHFLQKARHRALTDH
jgi:predicted HD phosphohydrolase